MTFQGTLLPYQPDDTARMIERRNALVGYEMGLGKQQPVSEPVLTPLGWRTIGDLVPGDEVIGASGKATRVLSVHHQVERAVYRVTFSDKSWTYCGPDHLWDVRSRNQAFRGSPFQTLPTRELAGNLHASWEIPLVSPVEYPEVSLPADPYLVGVALGDGTLLKSGGCVLCTDIEILDNLGLAHKPHATSPYTGYALVSPAKLGRVLPKALAAQKSVPEVYMRAPSADRLALLQGLLDTDGSPIRDGGIEFSSSSRQLAEQVMELAQSLGGTPRWGKPRTPSYTYLGERRMGQVSYRVNVKLPPDLLPFRLSRKLALFVPPAKYLPKRVIRSIEYSHEEASVCIRVAAADGLYVTRGHIVTHNTVVTIAALEELMDAGRIKEPGLIIALHSLKYQWASQITKFTGGTSVPLVIDGTPKQREALYADARNWWETGVDYVILNYEQVVNDWDQVRTLPRGFIVLDECHAIKGFRTQRAKRIKSLSTRVRFALTGTPVDNGKPEELYSIMQFVDPKILGRFDRFDKRYIRRNFFGGVDGYQNMHELHARLAPALIRRSQSDPDVAPHLPTTIFRDPVLVQFDRKSREVYRQIVADVIESLELLQEYGAEGSFDLAVHYGEADAEKEEWSPAAQAQGELMSRLTALRQLCDHPALLRISAELAQQGNGSGSKYAAELADRGLLHDLKATPKLDAVVRYVKDWLDVDDTHKVVLFSVYVPTLDLIAERLPQFGPVVYSGQMSAKAKEAAKVQFQTDPKTRLLISSDAGGYGVDLPQANLLLNYDLPWSPGAADQRNGRIRRASSQWPSVVIQDFLMDGSVEVWQKQKLAQKASVSNAVVDGLGIREDGDVLQEADALRVFLERRMV